MVCGVRDLGEQWEEERSAEGPLGIPLSVVL